MGRSFHLTRRHQLHRQRVLTTTDAVRARWASWVARHPATPTNWFPRLRPGCSWQPRFAHAIPTACRFVATNLRTCSESPSAPYARAETRLEPDRSPGGKCRVAWPLCVVSGAFVPAPAGDGLYREHGDDGGQGQGGDGEVSGGPPGCAGSNERDHRTHQRQRPKEQGAGQEAATPAERRVGGQGHEHDKAVVQVHGEHRPASSHVVNVLARKETHDEATNRDR